MKRCLMGWMLLGLLTGLFLTPASAQSTDDTFVPDLAQLSSDVFNLVNQERLGRHRKALPLHPGVGIAADLLAGDMAAGTTITQAKIDSRLNMAGYPPRVSGAVYAWVINFQYLSPSDAAHLPELIVDA